MNSEMTTRYFGSKTRHVKHYVKFRYTDNTPEFAKSMVFGVGQLVMRGLYLHKIRIEVVDLDCSGIPYFDLWQGLTKKNYMRNEVLEDISEAISSYTEGAWGWAVISLPEYLRYKEKLLLKSAPPADTKKRKTWVAYIRNTPVAKGVYYRDGNIQVLWRSDSGWTGEQYRCISYVWGLLPGVNRVTMQYPKLRV